MGIPGSHKLGKPWLKQSEAGFSTPGLAEFCEANLVILEEEENRTQGSHLLKKTTFKRGLIKSHYGNSR